MTNYHYQAIPEDFEQAARKSFFVAVCDCNEDSFVPGYGCVHPFHVVPASLIAEDSSALPWDDDAFAIPI